MNTLHVIHDPDDLRFYAKVAGEEAELTYTYPEERVMDLDYVYIPPSARNKRIQDHLVKACLEFARAHQYLVIPSCPVVEAYLARHPEYKDLIT